MYNIIYVHKYNDMVIHVKTDFSFSRSKKLHDLKLQIT